MRSMGMRSVKRAASWMTLLLSILLLVAAGNTLGAQPASQEPILIGVPLPLTGNLANAGSQTLVGMQYAVEEANKAGGVLGRPLKLIVDDTKGEPNQAAAIGTKMVAQDKVFAFVGGYGSTPDFALLQTLQRYKPIFVHPSSSATKLEEAFGREPWYFHVQVWDYMRAVDTGGFIASLNPKPQTVAIAHEDGLYGTDNAKQTAAELAKQGVQVVMVESFKSGSADFSPILNKVKALKPDIFYWVGYTGDNVQLARQAYSLQISSNNLMVYMNAENRPSDFGPAGKNLAVIDIWFPQMDVPGLKEWLAGIQAFKPGNLTVDSTVQGYTAMRSLIEAIKAAGQLDRDKVLKALETIEFWTPWGPMKYTEDRKTTHQLLRNMVVAQFTETDERLVWPPKLAKAKLVYPAKYGPGN